MFFVRQNATHKLVIGPVVAVANGYVPVTTLDLTTADEKCAVLHDNGTVVSISAYTFAALTSADGYYHLTLQSGITGTVGHVTIVINDDSLCLPVKAEYTVVEEAVYDAMYAAGALGYVANAPVSVAQWNGSNVATPSVAGVPEVDVTHFNGTAGTFASGRPEVNTTHAAGTAWGSGAITAASIAADAITDAKVASDVTIASVTGAVGSVTGAVGSVTGAVGSVTGNVGGNVTGSVGSVVGAVGSVTGAVGSVTGLTASDVGAIKAKTDSLAFTVAGQVDANIQYVNDVLVNGDGSPGTEWGP